MAKDIASGELQLLSKEFNIFVAKARYDEFYVNPLSAGQAVEVNTSLKLTIELDVDISGGPVLNFSFDGDNSITHITSFAWGEFDTIEIPMASSKFNYVVPVRIRPIIPSRANNNVLYGNTLKF
jgi:hypothetical protein